MFTPSFHSKLLGHKFNGVDGSSFPFAAPMVLGPQHHSQLQVSTIIVAKDSSFVLYMSFYLVYNFSNFWDDFFPCSHLKCYFQTPSQQTTPHKLLFSSLVEYLLKSMCTLSLTSAPQWLQRLSSLGFSRCPFLLINNFDLSLWQKSELLSHV